MTPLFGYVIIGIMPMYLAHTVFIKFLEKRDGGALLLYNHIHHFCVSSAGIEHPGNRRTAHT